MQRWISVPTFWVRIYLAADFDVAKQICREYCYNQGLCVNIHKCNYIFTGGEEYGCCVELINYPRFPNTPKNILKIAKKLALTLVCMSCQHSVLIMTPTTTEWYTRRI